MNLVLTLKALGGITGLKNAIQTKAISDIFCPINRKWYSEKDWLDTETKPQFVGYSLNTLLASIPLDATHLNGSFLIKIDKNDRIYEWQASSFKWHQVGWYPKDELEPLD